MFYDISIDMDEEAFEDPFGSHLMATKTQGLTDRELLKLATRTFTLRAALLLLIIVMIIFTIMKIFKLAYEMQYHYRKEREVPSIFL